MKFDFFTLDKIGDYRLIEGVKIHKLKVNKDSRGILVETLKNDWKDVFGEKFPFSQNYFSITKPGVARDEDRWHYHPRKQIDRFVVVKGNIIVTIYDWRKESSTKGLLNLFKMGEDNGDEGQYLLWIPINVLHGFIAIGDREAIILNYPTTLYDQHEEGRMPFTQVKLSDGSCFSWDLVRKLYPSKK